MKTHEKIKLIRSAKKMTQEEFAQEIGISRANLNNIELGKVNPTKLFINYVSLKFGISKDWLMNDDIDEYKIEDIYALPDGERVELIDGQIYYLVPPSMTHQIISGKLNQMISNYIDAKRGDCKVLAAPFAVFLSKDDKTYVEPDISVICDKDKLDERGCHGAPDWVIEIVSPNSKNMDYVTKLSKYQATGVREYWIVDPAKKRIVVQNFAQNTEQDGPDIMEMYTFFDTVKAGIYEDLYIDFNQIEIQKIAVLLW